MLNISTFECCSKLTKPLSPSVARVLAERTLDSEDLEKIYADDLQKNCWLPNLQLSIEDKNLLYNKNEWLNDSIMRAAQLCLRKQFPGFSGLKDPLLAAALKVRCADEVFVQILHNGNGHWLAVSNKGCREGTVSLYDSLHCIPSMAIKKQVAALAFQKGNLLTIECMNVQKQLGASDCGLMAIAFITCLLFEQDPVNVKFNQEHMRQHLINCLQSGVIKPFPVHTYRSVRNRVLSTVRETIYCSCRQIYVTGDNLIECTVCQSWYHPNCEGLSDTAFKRLGKRDKIIFKCSKCN